MNVYVDISAAATPAGGVSQDGKGVRGNRLNLHISPDSTSVGEAKVSTLCHCLEQALPEIHAYRSKLIHSGRLIPVWAGHDDTPLKNYGIRDGSVLKLMLSPKSAIDVVNSMKELPRMPEVDYEVEREKRRRASHIATSTSSPYVRRIQPWECPAGAYPDQNEARKLLRLIADDQAIAHIMQKHDWRIHILSEMPPMGRVGISPVCLLGCNVNKGAEISLRLRTDDMQGFRKFDMIRKTMIHELAHMVYSEHDDDFKRLNSTLNREAQEILSRRGQSIAGDTPVKEYAADSKGPHRFAHDDWETRYDGDARTAAGQAALSRHGKTRFSKGDRVRYFNKKDGVWQDATILAVDQSIQPPSYGIEIYDEHGKVHQRETEESRLDVAPHVNETREIKGMGHEDPTTHALEERVSGTLE